MVLGLPWYTYWYIAPKSTGPPDWSTTCNDVGSQQVDETDGWRQVRDARAGVTSMCTAMNEAIFEALPAMKTSTRHATRQGAPW